MRIRAMKKQSQNKPNLLDAQMNVSSILTKYYEKVPLRRRGENKPNQTQLQTHRSKGLRISIAKTRQFHYLFPYGIEPFLLPLNICTCYRAGRLRGSSSGPRSSAR